MVDVAKVAVALRALADALDASEGAPATTEGASAPTGKPRGRKAKGEDGTVALPAAAPAAAPAEPDPFSAAPPEETPVSLEEVRGALTALSKATTQALAVAVMTEVGGVSAISNLTADKYNAVYKAAKAKMPGPAPTPAAEADPFETAAPAKVETVSVAPEPTLEEVKAALSEAQKRTSKETVQKLLIQHGGSAAIVGGGVGPSMKALPVANYAALIAAVKGLPTTK